MNYTEEEKVALEFMEKFKDFSATRCTRLQLAQERIESSVGFPVKQIKSSIRKDHILGDQLPYLDNRYYKLNIIGSAFPMLSGWSIIDVNGKTIYTAIGEDGKQQSFTLGHYKGTSRIVFADSKHLDPENSLDYQHLTISADEQMQQFVEVSLNPPVAS